MIARSGIANVLVFVARKNLVDDAGESIRYSNFGFIGRSQLEFELVVLSPIKAASLLLGSVRTLNQDASQMRISLAALSSFFLPADSLLPAATPAQAANDLSSLKLLISSVASARMPKARTSLIPGISFRAFTK